MGLVRRLTEELLNIPLGEIRLQVFKGLVQDAPDELLWGILLALIALLATVLWALWKEAWRLAMRYPVPVLKLVGLVVGGFLALDALFDFLLPVLDLLLGRPTR